jgi:15-cis-phytoene desaturase
LILGGGVAGMSAAHELVARGFAVTVLERNAIAGGKARSIPAAADGLPGEHGFRFFPSFYQHLTDTLRGIPFGRGGRSVFHNLVNTSHTGAARFGRDLEIFNGGFPSTPAGFVELADDLFGNPFGLAPQETRFFAERLMQVATSCDERRLAEYEGIGWWQFIAAERFSDNYRSVFGASTRSLVAADPRRASVRTIGDISLQAVLGLSTPGVVYDRVLDGPTSAQWIEPWLAHLQARGVEYRRGCEVRAIDCDARGVRRVRFRCDGQMQSASADWYIAALPVERMAALVTPALRKFDPAFTRIQQLAPCVGWMNGLQFYLTRPLPIVRGHVLYIDTPWALTSISQAQFWPGVDWSAYGDGRIRDCLSIDISDWNTKGLCGKKARECTREQIRREVWRQLQMSLNVGGVLRLSDDMYHSHFLDPGIVFDRKTREVAFNQEPLLINEIGTWRLRPQAVTQVPNLFLASDYVQTHTDLACMEGANEAARRAVNGLIVASGAKAQPCGIWPLPIPEPLALWRARDRERYRRGLPWEAALFA